MSYLTTEIVAKSLAQAQSTEFANQNLFDSVSVIDTDDGQVISVQQETDGPVVFVTADEDQVRTVSHLWDIENIAKEQREQILIEMLRESMTLPLVSFGVSGNEVTLFGSMATSSGVDELIEEVTALFSATHMVVESLDGLLES